MIHPYISILMEQRSWSWTVITAAYLALTLVLRVLLFQGVLRETRRFNTRICSGVKRLYLKHSLLGWILYNVSVLLTATLWANWEKIQRKELWGSALGMGAVIFLLLSLLMHLLTYVNSLLFVLKEDGGGERVL